MANGTRKKKRPIKFVNAWSFSAEVGELVIYSGWVCRLESSSGRNKRDSGELYPRKIRKAEVEDIEHARTIQNKQYK